MPKPLSDYYVFPVFQTRADYLKVTGKEPPPFDPSLSPKYWEDPLLVSTEGDDYTVYTNVLATNKQNGHPLVGPDGNPYFRKLVLPIEIAGHVNIPYGHANEPGAGKPFVQVPCKDLQSYEKLEFGFGGIVVVNDTRLSVPVNFNSEDRRLIQEIHSMLKNG